MAAAAAYGNNCARLGNQGPIHRYCRKIYLKMCLKAIAKDKYQDVLDSS